MVEGDSPGLTMLGPPAGRRYSALDGASGRKAAAVFEAAPPPVEKPWWMKLHGPVPPVSHMEEVMDQFLCDPEMRALDRMCQRVRRATDVVRHPHLVVPGIEPAEAEALTDWAAQVARFAKYRQLVSEKHERKTEVGKTSSSRFEYLSEETGGDAEEDAESMSEANNSGPLRSSSRASSSATRFGPGAAGQRRRRGGGGNARDGSMESSPRTPGRASIWANAAASPSATSAGANTPRRAAPAASPRLARAGAGVVAGGHAGSASPAASASGRASPRVSMAGVGAARYRSGGSSSNGALSELELTSSSKGKR